MLKPQDIARLAPGKYLIEKSHKGAGRLVVRATSSGTKMFYFRYTISKGKRDTFPLGRFDPKGTDGLTLIDARNKAGELSRAYQTGHRNIRELISGTEEIVPASCIPAPLSPNITRSAAVSGGLTLKTLLSGYVQHLKAKKRASASQVEGDIESAILTPHPEFCDRLASSLISKDFDVIFNPITARKSYSTARKCRAYLHAAFQLAIKADFDPEAAPELKNSGITNNPIKPLPTFSEHQQPGERHLSDADLAAYISEVRKISDTNLRLGLLSALYLGGQRLKQLLRATANDVDLDGYDHKDSKGITYHIKTITLWDSKGRRNKSRQHVLPLVGEAEDMIRELTKINTRSESIFGCTISNEGEFMKYNELLLRKAQAISSSLTKAGVITETFSFGDLRRTCETLMARLGVTEEVRGRIQSHGLGGIQNRHYNRHDYILEKLSGITQLQQHFSLISVDNAEHK